MPEYVMRIDPANPGQYLACCGLFEAASIGDGDALAWFERDGTSFRIRTDSALPPKLEILAEEDTTGKPYEAGLAQVTLRICNEPFTLNWWLNAEQQGKSEFKTWGGQQTPQRMLAELIGLLPTQTDAEKLFEAGCYSTTRFGVDARTAWDALNLGYSPNDTGERSVTFPWVETLAAMGLQGFRPSIQGRRKFRYCLWMVPLGIPAARAAGAAPWPGLANRCMEFEVATRGQGYKTFQTAKEIA